MAVSIIDFGAVGDGITDDTVAIQAALNAADTVIVPAGVYVISEAFPASCALSLNTNNTLIGEGYGSVLKYVGVDPCVMVRSVGTDNVSVRDLVLDGNNQSGHGIRGGSNNFFEVENVHIKNVTGYGIGFEEGTQTGLRIHQVNIDGTGLDGIDSKNLNADTRGQYSDIVIRNFGKLDTDQAGMDIRGIFSAVNIQVYDVEGDNVGIRARETGVTTGEGGFFSQISNFYIEGKYVEGVEGNEDTSGLHLAAGRVVATNGVVRKVGTGYWGVGRNNLLSNSLAEDCIQGFYYEDTTRWCHVSHCQSRSNEEGFEFRGDDFILNGSIAVDNTQEGLIITATSNGGVVGDNIFRNNGLANVKLGTGIVQSNNVGY